MIGNVAMGPIMAFTANTEVKKLCNEAFSQGFLSLMVIKDWKQFQFMKDLVDESEQRNVVGILITIYHPKIDIA